MDARGDSGVTLFSYDRRDSVPYWCLRRTKKKKSGQEQSLLCAERRGNRGPEHLTADRCLAESCIRASISLFSDGEERRRTASFLNCQVSWGYVRLLCIGAGTSTREKLLIRKIQPSEKGEREYKGCVDNSATFCGRPDYDIRARLTFAPLRSTRRSACHRTARASTLASMSAPARVKSVGA